MIGIMLLSALVGFGLARLVGRHGRLAFGRCGGYRRRSFGPGPDFYRDDVDGGDPAAYGPWGHHRPPADHGAGWGPHLHRRVRRGIAHLLDRLEVTPAQERAIHAAVAELSAELRGLRDEGGRSRADLAAALRRPTFDGVLLGELFARHDVAIEKGRKAFVGLVAKLHDALEEPQRERLAALVERGPRALWSPFGW